MNEWYSSNNKNKRWEVLYRYNVMIVGFHNYYKFATRCTDDLKMISFIVYNKWKHLTKEDGYSKICKNPDEAKGFLNTNYFKKYSKSSLIRYVNNFPILPLSYINFSPPINCNNINRYSMEGREKLKKSFEVDESLNSLIMILDNETNLNTEYLINRHMKIINTKGICEITKKNLDKDNINCHHINPRYLGGNDKYDNLLIISKEIHILLHLVDPEKIKNMVKSLNLDAYQMRKVNKYRKILGLEKVSKELVL